MTREPGAARPAHGASSGAASAEPVSLSEVHRTVPIPAGNWLRRMLAFAGPAYLVSVGYMDPGNWATDLAGGARFGYQLLWVLLMSNLMAVLLQTLAARLGVVTGKDLAQACRDYYPRWLSFPLWILCEIAIVACDLAEVLGAAIGMKLLFGIPLLIGVAITALDVLLLLALSRLGMRRLEAIIVMLIATIGGCFAVEMLLSRPDVAAMLAHLIPRDVNGALSLVRRDPAGGVSLLGLDHGSLYVAMGILGATVMPHNLYLHSALVQSRDVERSEAGKRQACQMNMVDSVVALNCAFFVNAAILVLAAAVFHTSGHRDVARLEDAHRLLAPLLGTTLASVLFAVALLSSGQASTITGTLAGQIVMEGFLRIRIRPWLRRLISRGLAIVPAAVFIALRGAGAVDDLLVLSQVVLSLQLAFAVVPLIRFTSDRRTMGVFANPPWIVALAFLTAAAILGLNASLVAEQVAAWLAAGGAAAAWTRFAVLPAIAALAVVLAYVVVAPPAARLAPALEAPPPAAPGAAGAVRQAAADEPARTVAVALELGPADRDVLEHVRTRELTSRTRLVLLHVVESAAGRYLGPETSDLEAREDRATLEATADEFRARGIATDVRLGFGDPTRELARMVHEVGADLVITGSHGHRLFGDLLFGATVSGLRHRVRCPVLMVRQRRRP
ncbi:MAG: Nramp family divalent metal transporter [Candidatus Eisenbacteria bacterium]|uniref:Divalent metal cation transporter MntH n=1 Tax=Eiseniibacteriota bacterium TaxID=2212470 RepID=A0A9D6L6X5_UNCEI|nr:Nramp family divalent metal transporter [Candidatus Eisenbacteria bacterium]